LLPLKDQSNWVWLVTAALGGKALQKYAEVQQKQQKSTNLLLNPSRTKPRPPLVDRAKEGSSKLANLQKAPCNYSKLIGLELLKGASREFRLFI